MRDFACPSCGHQLAFENSLCLRCNTRIGFDPESVTLVAIVEDAQRPSDGEVPADAFRLCDNMHLARCNWIVRVDEDASGPALCPSCALTRTRPTDDDTAALDAFAEAEAAKRRLLVELTELRLPVVSRDEDPESGLAFDLLSSRDRPVTTGHASGVITLDLAEGDDAHREQLRVAMAEPYRTLLGHFRHEIGHYYQSVLVASDESRARFVELFGDPEEDYRAALDRYYADGPVAGWADIHVSAYASMHPAEDWAETFAHYLHLRDTLDTAAEFGLAPARTSLDRRRVEPGEFDRLIESWLPLAWSLNMLNRSMGRPDLYPFVLAPAVLDKMRFVHARIADPPAPGGADPVSGRAEAASSR
ncbi:putative zinc-binding metallopeptidase [Rhodococcus sp. NPDC003318]|uniref:zinc-binding metallopeptidase family protein n=1 Tax=Rhodococcus sp. NPDC003318 TaxID=3364503 RepID=UPI003692BA34